MELKPGYLALILHAHLPFVRHPEHAASLEETWLYEAITETYLPLLEILERLFQEGIQAPLTLTLSPTLCSMLRDRFLQDRYRLYLQGRIELAEKETFRTHWQPECRQLAEMYRSRFVQLEQLYERYQGHLIEAFRRLQASGQIEIIATAATHAFLPFLQNHPSSLRGQIRVACDHYAECFGRAPRGFWLPECAYVEAIEPALIEAGVRWFLVDTHGLLLGQPRPRYGVFAPVFTPRGLAVFGRDVESAKQVWSRDEGYPGDPRYRDFYRDIGYDLDLEYVAPCLPASPHRSFTGIKYHAITGPSADKALYDRARALGAAAQHAEHFYDARRRQMAELKQIMDQPPLLVCPYDAELFGHWWYEGPDFLEFLIRHVWKEPGGFRLATPSGFLEAHATHQVVQPAVSTWGEEGFSKVWLNEANQWMYPQLQRAQDRMVQLARRPASASAPQERALKQAARELLLAQSSDWPFILRANTSPDYARRRFEDHLHRFQRLADQIESGVLDEAWLAQLENQDNLFPAIQVEHWI